MPVIETRRLRILDTTLRDGDQAAGCAFTQRQKLEIARLLEECGVDCIEAGFPSSSSHDFEGCRLIASEIRNTSIAVMTRASIEDIRVSANAIAGASRGMLHLSLPVSSLHIERKLGKSESEILRIGRESVSFAAGLAGLIEIGAEDATRADRNFLLDYCGTVTEAGALIVNISDTVGYTVPDEFARLIHFLLEGVDAFRSGRSVLSVHCHNDFGLANANTLSAIGSGCGQIEVTGMGIGERAGNAALEEIEALLRSRADLYPVETSLVPSAIARIPRLISGILGTDFSPFKPVTGRNRAAHASGIHQHGIIQDRATYEPTGAILPGLPPARIVLSRHSGKAGLARFIQRYAGIELDEESLKHVLEEVKEACGCLPALGVSELLSILHSRLLIPLPPIECIALTVTENHTQEFSGFSAAASFTRSPSGAVPESCAVRSPSRLEVFLALAAKLFLPPIQITTLSFSGCGNPAPAMRLYLEATVAHPQNRAYALERTGTSLDMLLLQCLIDIINAEYCLTTPP